MELRDALVISMLGMAVVFAGLALTALLVFLVGSLPQLGQRLSRRRDRRERGPQPTTAPTAVDPEVVAVIAAALEVERRLHHAERGQRLTIERRT